MPLAVGKHGRGSPELADLTAARQAHTGRRVAPSKTALLEYLARQASGCRVARAVGVQSEMELAFAVLHQLCAPMLDRLERLPAPQRDALRTAFGMSRVRRRTGS
jgi:hypothetical protein